MLVLALALAVPLPDVAAPDTVPLYDNLGDHHYAVTTSVPGAQAYFDQGLRLYYAFNHAEAIRSFREAQRLDPACAMCFWGEALAWGPNINAPMDSASGVEAWKAVQRALKASAEPGRERAMIQALAARYAAAPPDDRATLDSAYARAMADVVRKYPDDPEAAVLYAESLMDLRPWDYWTPDRVLQPGMDEALRQLERVIDADEKHPGACHFYIHAVESAYPAQAVECAERLAGLMPGAGHLVHMPGHIYIRVGRYLDAIEANQHAVHADETYIRDQRPGVGIYTAGYYPHNYDFMAFAAAMAGRRDQAIGAADKLAELADPELMRAPGMAFMQHHVTRRLQMRIRFGDWKGILATPEPAADLPHARAMWQYARGRALVAQGRLDEAQAALDALDAAAADPRLTGVRLEFNESPAILGIAREVLAGSLASARGDHAQAIVHLKAAARLEDGLTYGEPPDWSVPVRHDLGAVYLAAGQPVQAEAVYRKDLDRFPRNVWSVTGLVAALRAQGRAAELARQQAELKQLLADADVTPASSRY